MQLVLLGIQMPLKILFTMTTFDVEFGEDALRYIFLLTLVSVLK